MRNEFVTLPDPQMPLEFAGNGVEQAASMLLVVEVVGAGVLVVGVVVATDL